MITTAKVIETNGNMAVVEAERKSACVGCENNTNGKSCSACSLLGGNKTIRASAKNAVGAKIGDKVQIESSSGRMLLYAFLVFILPIVAAVVSYAVAISIAKSESIGLLFAAISFFAIVLIDVTVSKAISKNTCDVNIIKIIEE